MRNNEENASVHTVFPCGLTPAADLVKPIRLLIHPADTYRQIESFL